MKESALNRKYRSIICIEDSLTFKTLTDAAAYYKMSIGSLHNYLTNKIKKLKNGKTYKYEI